MIPIVVSTDDNFINYTLVTIYSIIINTKKKVKIYVFASKLNKKNKIKIKKFEQKHNNLNIEIIEINIKKIKNLITLPNLPIQTYYRLLIPNYILENKIIYLDSDIIVLKDISKLYKINFDNKYILAVKDLYINKHRKEHLNKINLLKYFNAGVLVLNLKKIKNEKLFEKTIKWIEKNKDKIISCDQDGLNVIFNKKVKFISIKWNYAPEYMYDNKKYNQSIIHYMGAKPWKKRFEFITEKNIYEKYYYFTHNNKLIKKGKNKKFINYIYYILKYRYNNELFNKIEKTYRLIKNRLK